MMKDGGHHGDEETTMTAKIERRVPFRHLARTVTPTVVIVMLLGLGSPVGATTSSSVALSITEYALATATHDRPAHVVTAADITNATGINTVNTKNLYVLINLGDVFGYSRLVLFFDQKLFSDICVNFPNTVGGAPGIIACPTRRRDSGTAVPARWARATEPSLTPRRGGTPSRAPTSSQPPRSIS
jgi:flavin reductase (DIM6/NTAB) family NADH-FMN oxidoreductase RutF